MQKEVADEMKAERKTDGTLRYAAKDVDKAYNDALDAVFAAAYDVVAGVTGAKLNKATVDNVMANVKEQDFPLQQYKEAGLTASLQVTMLPPIGAVTDRRK